MALRKHFSIALAKSFLCFLTFMALASVAHATDWYVSTGGTPSGSGTQSSPWDLCTAIGCTGTPPSQVQPGDTIWLSGGTYEPPTSDGFIFNLNGTSSAAIWVRNIKAPPSGYTGQLNPDGSERVILDGNGQNFPNLGGQYTTVEGLEFSDHTLQSSSARYLSSSSSCVATYNASLCPTAASAIEAMGPGDRVVHCFAHDNAAGIYSYESAPNAEMYGNISVYNGYIYGGVGYGHGFYDHNSSGNKWLTNNFSGDNADNGFQVYGQGSPAVGFVMAGNAAWDNASIVSTDYQYNFILGDAAGIGSDSFDSFYSFFPLGARQGYFSLGQYGPNTGSISLTNSVIAGGYSTLGVEGITAPLTITGNKFVNAAQNSAGLPTASVVFAQFTNQNTSGIVWNDNSYVGPNSFYIGTYDGLNLSNGSYQSFASWQSATKFDAASTYSTTLPTGAWVYVLPDKYTTKRANIIIYNWNAYADAQGDLVSPCTGACASVAVDLSSVLSVGDPFTIQDAQNWEGPHVLTGTYQGGNVSIPMTGLTKPVPWGLSTAPPHTAPAFGTFVVFSSNSVDIPQPGQSDPVTTPTPAPTPTPTPTPAPLALSNPNLPNGQVGVTYSGSISASGGTPPYSFTATGLAPGLSISASTGAVSGTPSAAGSYSAAITVTDSAKRTASATYTYTIAAAPAPAPTAAFTIGQQVVTTRTANLRSSNSTSPLGSVTGREPAGAVGTIVAGPTPVPATGTPQDYLWQVQFAGATGWVWQSVLAASTSGSTPPPSVPTVASVSINPQTVSLQVGAAQPFTATVNCTSPGCNQSVTWSATAGSIDSLGNFLAPSTTGPVTVTVTSTQGSTKSAVASVTVVPDPPAPTPPPPPPPSGKFTVTISALPSATLKTAYTPFQIIVSGGTPPYRLFVQQGSLPVGMSLSSAGVLSGTPTAYAPGGYPGGSIPFYVYASDSAGNALPMNPFWLAVN
jgi:hypothetical protein